MPATNYKLSEYALGDLRQGAETLLQRTTALAESGFPLTRDQVMDALLTKTEQEQFNSIRRKLHIVYNRWVNVRIKLPDILEFGAQVRFGVQGSQGYGDGGFPVFNEDVIPFDVGVLDPELRESFINWFDDAVHHFREVQEAIRIIREFLSVNKVPSLHGGSMESIHARWPEFMVVPLSLREPWPERVRSRVRGHRDIYDWPREHREWYFKNEEKMEYIGAILAGAQILTVPEVNPTGVRAEITEAIDLRKEVLP